MDASWQACLVAFLDSIQDISGSTWSRKVYASILRRFLADTPRTFADATRADVTAFLNAPSRSRRNYGQPVGASAKNLRQTVLHNFFKYASLYEVNGVLLYQNRLPTAGMRYLKVGVPWRAMAEAELTRFFATIPDDTPRGLQDRAAFLTVFWTAKRRAEIAGLRWGDIEATVFPDGRVAWLFRYQGKGKSRTTKTAELPGPAYAAIDRALTASGRKETIQPGDALFLNKYGAPLSAPALYLRFRTYARAAGLDTTRISLHSLRHTAARERHKAGQDVLDIKELLDHSSLDTTWRYLVGLSGQQDTGAALIADKFAHLSGGR